MFVPPCGRLRKCELLLTLDFLPLCLSPPVDHALHPDAGVHTKRGGGLRGGCVLWIKCGCVALDAMVRFLNTI